MIGKRSPSPPGLCVLCLEFDEEVGVEYGRVYAPSGETLNEEIGFDNGLSLFITRYTKTK